LSRAYIAAGWWRELGPPVRQALRRTSATHVYTGRGDLDCPRRNRRLPEYLYDEWLENVLLYDDPEGCAEKIARLRDAGVERLLLWMGPGGVAHELLVRSMRLFAEEVAPRFR